MSAAFEGFELAELLIDDPKLKPIAEKVLAGERLGFNDGITLYRTNDLLAIGWLANRVREQRHGNVTFYNVNRHINPTNVCVAHCRLCAFGRSPDAPGAYTFALDEIYQRAEHPFQDRRQRQEGRGQRQLGSVRRGEGDVGSARLPEVKRRDRPEAGQEAGAVGPIRRRSTTPQKGRTGISGPASVRWAPLRAAPGIGSAASPARRDGETCSRCRCTPA